MDKNFYDGFEKQAFMGAARAGLSAIGNIARSSEMAASARSLGRNVSRGNFARAGKSVGMLGRSTGRAVNQGVQALGAKYPKQMASVKAMGTKVRTGATNLMNSARNTMGTK